MKTAPLEGDGQFSSADDEEIANESLYQSNSNISAEYQEMETVPLEVDWEFGSAQDEEIANESLYQSYSNLNIESPDQEMESQPLEVDEEFGKNPDQPKTVAIVSLMTNKFKGTYMAHWVLIQSYCERHNYTCSRFTGMEAKYKDSPYIEALELPKHWRKLIGVYAFLKKFDFVLFLDVDNFILKPSLRVEDLFEDERTSIVFSGDPCFSSSHFFALRKNQVGFDFLQTWWQFRVFFKDNCHYDQGAFIMAMIATTSRHLHVARNIEHVNNDLHNCAAFVYGAREMTLKTMCSSYQRCLQETCERWILPVGSSDPNDPARIWLEDHIGSDLIGARERKLSLPISWNRGDWRKNGWDKDISFSLQGTRTTVFTDCRSTFSVHPVKKLHQMACEIADPEP